MRTIAGNASLVAVLAATAAAQTVPNDLNSYVTFGARRLKISKYAVVGGGGAGSNGVLVEPAHRLVDGVRAGLTAVGEQIAGDEKAPADQAEPRIDVDQR